MDIATGLGLVGGAVVIFVLIMLEMIQSSGITLELPQSSSAQALETIKITIGVDKGGDFPIGINGAYLDVWRISLAYTHFYGKADTATYASSDPTVNGTYTFAQSLADRDFVALSVKYAF